MGHDRVIVIQEMGADLYEALFPEIAESMCRSIDIYERDEEKTCHFYYEDNGCCVTGSVKVRGMWRVFGDGIESPRQWVLYNGKGAVESLELLLSDSCGDWTGTPEELVDRLRRYLNDSIEDFIKNYSYC